MKKWVLRFKQLISLFKMYDLEIYVFFRHELILFSYGRVDRWEVITPDKYTLKIFKQNFTFVTGMKKQSDGNSSCEDDVME